MGLAGGAHSRMAVRGHQSMHVHTPRGSGMDPKERAQLVSDALRVRAMVCDALRLSIMDAKKWYSMLLWDRFLSTLLIAYVNP